MSGALSELREIVQDLNDDELATVIMFATRIRAGRDAYGGLDLAKDRRDFRKEAAEEIFDFAAYILWVLRRDFKVER